MISVKLLVSLSVMTKFRASHVDWSRYSGRKVNTVNELENPQLTVTYTHSFCSRAGFRHVKKLNRTAIPELCNNGQRRGFENSVNDIYKQRVGIF